MSSGGIESDLLGGFRYYASQPGTHTLTVTVINDRGLYATASAEIKVAERTAADDEP